MKDTPPLPMLVLLPGLDGTGKLFAAFVRALGAGVADGVLRRRIAAILAVDAVESLDRIAIPALVMYGRRDRVVPNATTRSLIAHLPGAVVADIDGPHLLLQACPEECSAAVLKFMTAPQVLSPIHSQH